MLYLITAQRFGSRNLELLETTPSLPRARRIQHGTRRLLEDLFTDPMTGALAQLWDVRLYQLALVEAP